MASGRRFSAGVRARTGLLVRLHRSARGNVAVMMAVMLVPLLLFVGSAVDVSRVYTVKARLQQACDAGVLAGKRSMVDSSTLDATAVAQAKAFFASNFHFNQDSADLTKQGAPGWMQTVAAPDLGAAGKYQAVFTPSRTDEGQVSGRAVVQVPMAIMRVFGFKPLVLTATCEARQDTADADIMFVLDVTGSMACLTSDKVSDCNSYASTTNNVKTAADGTLYVLEKDNSRIDGLRAAVLSFFDTVTKLKANQGNADPSTNFRFGFVPYNAVANVGKLLQPLGYVKTSAAYQTRYVAGDTINSSSALTDLRKSPSSSCPASKTRTPTTVGTFNSNGTASQRVVYWDSSASKCYQRDDVLVPTWQYKKDPLQPFDTTQYITPGATVANPTEVDGTMSAKWAGCVEERYDATSDNQTTFSYTTPPKDLDPDTAPATAADKWTPWWPDVTYYRLSDGELSGDTTRTYFGRPYYTNGSYYWPDLAKIYNAVACPYPAQRLTQTTLSGAANSSPSAKQTVRDSINTYLNALVAYGTTYHDVGMLWGLRLISPSGMFASDTAAWPGHNAPNRYIIFLTDGDMESDPVSDGGVYSTNGMEKFDGRVANGATGSALNSYHNARFTYLCQLAKNRNIKIFTIAYAQSKTQQLIDCASPGQDYYASDADKLKDALGQIAQQIGLLRVSK